MIDFLLKIGRFVIYSVKGNYTYAFEQFDYTTNLRRKVLHICNAKNIKQNDSAAVFDLKHAKDRYAFNLINTYKLADYDIYLYPNYEFYTNSKGLYFEDIFTFLKVGYIRSESQLKKYKRLHYVHDHVSKKEFKLNAVYVKVNDKNAIALQGLKFPFGFHPNTYKRLSIKTSKQLEKALVNSLKKETNNIKIFFAGATSGDDYYQIKNYFPHIIDRNTIFNLIRSNFNDKIKSIQEINDNAKSIFIHDSLSNTKIDEDELFKLMKRSDFFIAPPGFKMPFCHNLYEAMSCGMIPIIQYSNFLYPQLEDSVNCLMFDSVKDLERCIHIALNMPTEVIAQMKDNVSQYFNINMLPINFIYKIETEKIKLNSIHYISDSIQ